ncbi:MAG TPA: hypothetical protein VMB73_22385 [Acetobacteraceae bacterium]|nr:hypothetical protein [Acetobacteraceae bacterium]
MPARQKHRRAPTRRGECGRCPTSRVRGGFGYGHGGIDPPRLMGEGGFEGCAAFRGVLRGHDKSLRHLLAGEDNDAAWLPLGGPKVVETQGYIVR